ncbi:hypothetical protein HDE_01480 [Halotydeus destructor]|nr:hypothetical protein HDE_01480 [Halotydeus destructor]
MMKCLPFAILFSMGTLFLVMTSVYSDSGPIQNGVSRSRDILTMINSRDYVITDQCKVKDKPRNINEHLESFVQGATLSCGLFIISHIMYKMVADSSDLDHNSNFLYSTCVMWFPRLSNQQLEDDLAPIRERERNMYRGG